MINKIFTFKNGLIVIIGLAVALQIIIFYEVLMIKENSIFSKGNCRVINTKLALDSNYNILVMKQISSGNTHLIAIDENDILHDSSKNTIMDNKSLKEFENDAIMYFFYNTKKESYFDYQDTFIAEKFIFKNYLIFFNIKHKILGFY